MRIKVIPVVDRFLEDFPIFKKVMNRKKNGDSYESFKELVADEKKDFFRPAVSPDSFADAVERIPDVSLVERFDAIAQLDAAIASIDYQPVKNVDDENK